jgi:hypothetical protein
LKLRPVLSIISLLFFFVVALTTAKDPPPQVMLWPDSGQSVLRFSFGRFKESGSVGKRHSYTSETTAENLWNKKISEASFSLYLFDKDKIRIGEAWISVSNVAAGEVVKFPVIAESTGVPISMTIAPRLLPAELRSFAPPKAISVTVNSIPQGATVKLDGSEAGVTPKVIQVTPGKHMLEFSKQGFNSGHFPLEISSDDVSGGSVSYELGVSSYDTVELRDESVLSGNVESVSATEVIVKVGGNLQKFDRNQIKRIAFVPREPAVQ